MKNLLSFQLLELINATGLSTVKGGGYYNDMLAAGKIGIKTEGGILWGNDAMALQSAGEWWPTGNLGLVDINGNDLGAGATEGLAGEWWPTGNLGKF
ncbi:MAG: hypothetical protein RJA07_2512 [Bacteroidota bacterium]|jgi:hypothetical protein